MILINKYQSFATNIISKLSEMMRAAIISGPGSAVQRQAYHLTGAGVTLIADPQRFTKLGIAAGI